MQEINMDWTNDLRMRLTFG